MFIGSRADVWCSEFSVVIYYVMGGFFFLFFIIHALLGRQIVLKKEKKLPEPIKAVNAIHVINT